MAKQGVIECSFFVPFRESAKNYEVKIMSDRFVDSDTFCEINLESMRINMEKMYYTNLLDLKPLKISALKNPLFENTL